MNKKRVIIIGGGISGLAAAHRLNERSREENSLEITLLEASDRLGGVIETESRDGFLLERGPDAFISEKPWAHELCKQLGLEKEIIGTRDEFRRSFIYQTGKLVPVPTGFYLIAPTNFQSLIRTSLLSRAAKLRMACEWFIPRRRDGGDESIASFVRRRFGKETLLKIGQPMIGGIYMADPERLSLEATLPRFQEMERRHGSVMRALQVEKESETSNASGPRYSLFLSLKEGMEKLVTALIHKMPDVKLRTSTPVVRIEKGKPWKIHLENGECLEADVLCLALAVHQAARLIHPFAEKLAADLDRIPYESVATVNVAFRKKDVGHPLDGFGFVIPRIEKKTITACTFSSVKYPGRSPEDSVLLRAFVGGALDRQSLESSDRELEQKVVKELEDILGITGKTLFVSVRRYPHSMPQYQVGHLALVRSIEEQLKNFSGLYLTGNAYRGVGIPDCIHHAENTADVIHAFSNRNNS